MFSVAYHLKLYSKFYIIFICVFDTHTHTHTHTQTYIYIYIYIYCHPETDCFTTLKSKVKLTTVVDGYSKVPFLIATPRCKEGRNSFPWITSLYPWSILLWCWRLSKKTSSTIFRVFGIIRPWIELALPSHWRTLYHLAYALVYI